MSRSVKRYSKRAWVWATACSISVAAGLVVVFAFPAGAQSGAGFEVTSVKLSHAATGTVSNQFSPNSVSYRNVSLRELILEVCRVNDAPLSRIFGGPGWLASDRWHIDGRAPDSPPGKRHNLQPMLCSLLEDRFHLAFHYEKRLMPSYDLEVAEGGSKMKAMGESPPMMRVSDGLRSGVSSMRDFAFSLRSAVHRQVIDQTGLAGSYELRLTYSSEELGAGAAGDQPSGPDPTRPSIFTALQEQLGLRLVRRDTPQAVLVMEHVEKPSEN